MFIAFEGLDGSGSSTQSALLTAYIQSQGAQAVLTKEPTNNILGGVLRAALTKQIQFDPVTLQLIFAADRGHHLDRLINPTLAQSGMVISDRYMMSTLAFGSLAGIEMEWLHSINSQFRKPDLTILLKVSPAECMRRIESTRIETELFEQEQKLMQIWQGYEQARQYFENVHVIDGMQSKEEIHQQCIALVESSGSRLNSNS